jgi:hypothetical protein
MLEQLIVRRAPRQVLGRRLQPKPVMIFPVDRFFKRRDVFVADGFEPVRFFCRRGAVRVGCQPSTVRGGPRLVLAARPRRSSASPSTSLPGVTGHGHQPSGVCGQTAHHVLL